MTTPTTAEQIDAVLREFSFEYLGPAGVAFSLKPRQLAAALLDARATIARLEGELEVERMRLAACAVAARGGEVRDILPPYDSDSLRAVVALRTRADAAERRVEAVTNAARLYIEARVAVDWAKTEREIAQTAKGIANKGEVIASAHKALYEKCNARDAALSELIAVVRTHAASGAADGAATTEG